jgi:hypothetical protein
LSWAWKQLSSQDFLTKMRTRACLVPNLNHEIRKTIIRTWDVWNKNLTRFYYKEGKKKYDKKTYPKLMLNRLKVMENSISIYTHWAPSSLKSFSGNF